MLNQHILLEDWLEWNLQKLLTYNEGEFIECK